MSNSSERTPDGKRNFKSAKFKLEAKNRQDNIKKNLEDNERRALEAEKKPKDRVKIQKHIDAGKSLISKFINGVTAEERANIKADMDDTITHRLNEVYQSSVIAYAEHTDYGNSEKLAKSLDQQLFAAISLGLAIKLNKASTDTERRSNKSLSSLECNIKLPKKLAVVLDQVGKTDVPGDNHFRIRNQNFAARRHLVRGIYYMIGSEELKDWIGDTDGTKLNELKEAMENETLFSNMVDNSSWSLDRIKEIGKTIYTEVTRENFEFWDKNDKDTKYQFRLPKVDLENVTIKTIGNIMSNKLFSAFGFDKTILTRMISGLVLACVTHTWIKQPGKKMEELDSAFNGTWFQGKTFKDVLAYCNVWNLNFYFDDVLLNDIAITAIERWNTGSFKHFSRFLELIEINFSEHGSPAQIVQVEEKAKDIKKRGFFDYVNYTYKGKARSKTSLKNISDSDFLMGIMSGYTKNLEFSSNWEIEFNSTNKQILAEFLKNDFKDTY